MLRLPAYFSRSINPISWRLATLSNTPRISARLACSNAVSATNAAFSRARIERISATSTSFTSNATKISPSERTTRSNGKQLAIQPSTNVVSPCLTGRNSDGIEIDARIASNSFPRSKTTSSPVYRSVATARNGIGNDSISTSGTISIIASIIRSPLTR